MSDDEVLVTHQQMRDAQTALDIAAFNGLVQIAVILKRHDLASADELAFMHEMITKPLSLPENANNPLIQDAHRNLDDLFATVLDLP